MTRVKRRHYLHVLYCELTYQFLSLSRRAHLARLAQAPPLLPRKPPLRRTTTTKTTNTPPKHNHTTTPPPTITTPYNTRFTMDNHPRRPPRVPITTAPPPRRLFHHPTSTTAHAPRPNPRTTTSKPPTVHIPADTTPDPSADLVERDSSGAYKIIGAPPASLRLSATPPEEEDEEEREQEEHLMGLYGRGASGLEKSGE